MAEKAKKQTKRPSALKRVIQSKKKRLRSKSFKASVQTAVRALKEAQSRQDAQESITEKLNKVYSLLDKGVKKGFYKTNKAARTKSRLTVKAS